MKEKILQMVDAYWKFDEAQQPISNWHDKQDLLKALEELLQPAVIKSVFCECETPLLVAEDTQLAEECFRCFKKIKQKTV